jgi:broad specificity phosphatase PhoE
MQFIYVIRHGETDANAKGQVNDKNVKIPINATGKKQAKKTGKYMANRNLKDYIIYSSPSERARQTAQIIAKEMKYVGEIIIDERLNELDHGLLSGSVEGDDIHNEYMKEFNKLPTDPIDLELEFPVFDVKLYKKFKCESLAIASKRVANFYKDLPKTKNIVLIAHGGIINVTINVLFNIMPQLIGDVSNGKNCTIMCIMKETKSKKYKLITLPNTLHLK